ncbi:MAG: ABC transporter ATP-binding protein [Chloroflexi bacterium]|nr:ABC transporter ATP-binding protein [Chloroflexota bacterium]
MSTAHKETPFAIQVKNLNRIFKAKIGIMGTKTKEVIAVEDVSFNVERGGLFGLLGPNGAGKTTIVKMLTTLLIPNAGTANILGYDLVKEAAAIRPRIGFIFGGERGLYWRLNAYDNLRYFANLYHVDPDTVDRKITGLLDMVGLAGRGVEKIEGYSRGMKQRLHIARALLHDPEVLFLDEPTIGLDPVGARQLRTLIRELKERGKTILLTTHYMFEADTLCDVIAVIDQGKIVAHDSPEALKQLVNDLSVIEIDVFGIIPETIIELRALAGVDTVSVQDRDHKQVLRVQSSNGSETVAPVMRILEDKGLRMGGVTIREPTLEDAYVRLVGGEV